MSDSTSRPDGNEADRDEKIDDAARDTFPASDPPSTGGSTGPNDGHATPAPRTP